MPFEEFSRERASSSTTGTLNGLDFEVLFQELPVIAHGPEIRQHKAPCDSSRTVSHIVIKVCLIKESSLQHLVRVVGRVSDENLDHIVNQFVNM